MAVSRRLTSLRLDKIAAVDAPCQEHAVVAIVKRRPDDTPLGIAKATFAEALQANMTADAINDAFFDSFNGLYERNAAFKAALTDELAAGGDGATASTDYVASVKQLVDDAVAAARSAGATTGNTAPIDKALTAAADRWLISKQQETQMLITTVAQLSAAIAKYQADGAKPAEIASIKKAAVDLGQTALLPAELAVAPAQDDDLAKKFERLQKSVALSGDIAKHYASLTTDAERDAFLAKDAVAQNAEVIEKNSGDPVLYTCTDGTQVRKSAGELALMMAKRADAQDKVIAALTDTVGASSIEKRAAAFPNIAKSVSTSMLKAIDLMPEGERPAALASLTAMNKSQGSVFNRAGGSGDATLGGDEGGDETIGKMSAIVKRIAKADNITEAQATVKALSGDAEYRDLYQQQLAEVPHVERGSGSPAA